MCYDKSLGKIEKEKSLRSMVGLVIQATGRTEFEDGLRLEALGRSFVTDSASALAHWSHLYCEMCGHGRGVGKFHLLVWAPSASRSVRIQQ